MNFYHTPIHFDIPADDMDRAASFYKNVFGWKIEAAGPDFADYMMVSTVPVNENMVATEPGINGGMMKRSNPGQQIINYINVEDIDEYLKKIEENGGTVLMPKMPIKGIGWNAVAQDTEGNSFGLFQGDMSAE